MGIWNLKTKQVLDTSSLPKIPSDWKWVSINEIQESSAMGPFGSRIKSSNYIDFGIPMLRGKNISNGFLTEEELVFLTEEKADELKNSNVYELDILFTAYGSIGDVGIILPTSCYSRYVLSQNLMKLTCNQEKINPLFVYYYFKTTFGNHMLLRNAHASGVPAIGQAMTTLRNTPIVLPPKNIQNKIVQTIFSLDTQITSLKNQNKILEQIVQAIFKSWFVDFDGVTDFEDSELGKIPKGWGVKSFSDIYFITDYTANGSFASLKENVTYSYTPDYAILVRQVDFNNNWNDNYVYVDKHSYDFLKKSSLISGDVMISNIGNVGIVFRVPDLGQPMTGAPNVLVVKTEEFNREFAYSYLFSEVGQNMIKSITSGSAQPKFNKTDFRNHLFVYPNRKSLDKFHEKVSPITQLITKNEKLIKLLQDSKYSLLPKLMSGEIRV
jgi:type I restriction enzyme, S subunit